MAYEQKDMRWSLFRNDRKQKDSDPDYTGSGKIEGREVWVNAWLNETSDGRKYFSGSFKFKETKPEDPQAPLEPKGGSMAQELDDSIPFSPVRLG